MRPIIFTKKMTSLLVLPYLVGGCGSSATIKPRQLPQKVEKAAPIVAEDEKAAFALLGQGSNSLSGQLVGSCIVGDLPSSNILGRAYETPEYAADGQQIFFDHKEVSSTNELRNSMEISATANANWGTGQGEARASFFEKSVVKQDDLNIYYYVAVKNPEVKMSNVRLSPEALELLEKQGPSALYKRCGDEAIIGYQTGGEIHSLFQISKRDKTDQRSIALAASGAGVIFSASGEIKIDESNSKNEIRVDVKATFSGGKGEIIETSPAAFKSQAESWAKVVAQHGVVLKFVKVKYSELAAGAIDPQISRMQKFMDDLQEEYDRIGDYLRIFKEELHVATDSEIRENYVVKAAEADQLRDEINTKLATCQKSLQFEHCVDTQLTFKVRMFGKDVFEKREDPSCGVATWALIQHTGCGFTNKDVARTNFPLCGVELYKGKNEGICPTGTLIIGGGSDEGCGGPFVRRPEYGVEKYKDCTINLPIANTCRLPGSVPETYKVCIVKPKTSVQ